MTPKITKAPRSADFFQADVCETLDYVLDQAAMYADQENFVAAVIERLREFAGGDRESSQASDDQSAAAK